MRLFGSVTKQSKQDRLEEQQKGFARSLAQEAGKSEKRLLASLEREKTISNEIMESHNARMRSMIEEETELNKEVIALRQELSIGMSEVHKRQKDLDIQEKALGLKESKLDALRRVYEKKLDELDSARKVVQELENQLAHNVHETAVLQDSIRGSEALTKAIEEKVVKKFSDLVEKESQYQSKETELKRYVEDALSKVKAKEQALESKEKALETKETKLRKLEERLKMHSKRLKTV